MLTVGLSPPLSDSANPTRRSSTSSHRNSTARSTVGWSETVSSMTSPAVWPPAYARMDQLIAPTKASVSHLSDDHRQISIRSSEIDPFRHLPVANSSTLTACAVVRDRRSAIGHSRDGDHAPRIGIRTIVATPKARRARMTRCPRTPGVRTRFGA